jgi:hypothetical protein
MHNLPRVFPAHVASAESIVSVPQTPASDIEIRAQMDLKLLTRFTIFSKRLAWFMNK